MPADADVQRAKVLEFNCRFAIRKRKLILPRFKGGLDSRAGSDAYDGKLSPELVQWKPEACVCCLMASGGYPGSYRKALPSRPG